MASVWLRVNIMAFVPLIHFPRIFSFSDCRFSFCRKQRKNRNCITAIGHIEKHFIICWKLQIEWRPLPSSPPSWISFSIFFFVFFFSRLHLFVSKRLFSMSRTMALHRMILMWVAFCTVDILNGSDSNHDDDDGNYDSSDTNWNVPNELNPTHSVPYNAFSVWFRWFAREFQMK